MLQSEKILRQYLKDKPLLPLISIREVVDEFELVYKRIDSSCKDEEIIDVWESDLKMKLEYGEVSFSGKKAADK